MRPWSVTRIRLTVDIPTLPPRLFVHTYSEVGEEREEFSPKRRNKPFFLIYAYILCPSICIMYICTHLLIIAPVGGSAGQPPLAPNERLLSQRQATSFK